MASPRVCIIGPGAIGGWLAARLAPHCDLTIVARPGPHLAAIQASGLTLLSHQDGTSVVAIRAVSDKETDLIGVQDVIFLATKAQSLEGALPAVLPLLSSSTVIVPLVNGIPFWMGTSSAPLRSVDPHGTLTAALPVTSIVGAVVYSSGSLDSPGVVRHASHGRIVFGAPGGGSHPNVEVVAGLFAKQPLVAVELTQDIQASIFTKLMGNVSLNLICALTLTTSAGVLADPATRGMVADMMGECAAVAAAAGTPCTMSVEKRLAISGSLGNDFRPSTLQDVERGVPTEVEAIGGALLELAAAHGVAVPVTSMVVALMRLRDAALQRQQRL